MNTYSDNQTGHLYVLSNNASNLTISDSMVVGNTVDHMFNIKFKHGGVVDEVSDNIDDRRILKIDVKAVKPVYFRKWTVKALTVAPKPETLYSLYFYLENMQGFGMQDRWDIAATYKTDVYNNGTTVPATHDTIATVMQHLAMELYAKINVNGPIKNDFIISYGGKDITEKDYEAYVNNDTLPTATSGNNIVVRENDTPGYPTYTHNDMEILMGAAPYEYDLTLSTYDGNSTWGGNARRIIAENTSTVRFASGVVVKDMENFFMRNRKDLYSLSPNFNTSIINEGNADRTKYYSMVNVHYAYSDSLGFTYYSEKDLNIAVVEASEGSTTNGTAFMNAINAKSVNGQIASLDARVTTLENA